MPKLEIAACLIVQSIVLWIHVKQIRGDEVPELGTIRVKIQMSRDEALAATLVPHDNLSMVATAFYEEVGRLAIMNHLELTERRDGWTEPGGWSWAAGHAWRELRMDALPPKALRGSSSQAP